MSNISINQTIKYTKNLSLLYVEDDLALQAQSKEFFEVLFERVVCASNGQEALEIYKHENFDIIISDIKMPIMDGIELTTIIKEMDPAQCVIITSAYNDAEYLMKFINLNIRQFLQKPINVDNMLETLYYVSKYIINATMVEEYRKTLEGTNKELKETNSELQSLVRILDSKLTQLAKKESSSEEIINILQINLFFTKEQLQEIEALELDMNGVLSLIDLSQNLTSSNLGVLANIFNSYADIIQLHKVYNPLAIKISALAENLHNTPDACIKNFEKISTDLESFIYVLRIWRRSLLNNETQKAFLLHISMINDIETILAVLTV